MASSNYRLGDMLVMLRSPRVLLLAIVSLFLISLSSLSLHSRLPTLTTRHFGINRISGATQEPSTPTKPDPIHNSTLGFERVFLLNLPERYDKLDAFSLSSSLHSFTFQRLDGVDGARVPNKTLPPLDDHPKLSEIGTWRAHLNVAQIMVRERVSTAIVFEDDADWDVAFRTQLEQFAQGSRYITSSWQHPTELKSKVGGKGSSPYGDNWDLLWLGHAGVFAHPSDSRQFIISNDPTVPSPPRRVNYQDVPDLSDHSNSTRIIFRIGSGVCLYAYALSYRGAQKMLLTQSTLPKFLPVDIALRGMCQEQEDFKCIGVFPQIVDSHKAAGRTDRDSDNTIFDKTAIREKGYTANIVRSTRLNWAPVLVGDMGKVEVQFPNETPEISGEVTMKPG